MQWICLPGILALGEIDVCRMDGRQPLAGLGLMKDLWDEELFGYREVQQIAMSLQMEKSFLEKRLAQEFDNNSFGFWPLG